MIIACFPLSELLIAVKFIDLIIKDVSGIYNDFYEQKRIGRTNRTKGDRRLYFSRAYDRIKTVMWRKKTRKPKFKNGVMQDEGIGDENK